MVENTYCSLSCGRPLFLFRLEEGDKKKIPKSSGVFRVGSFLIINHFGPTHCQPIGKVTTEKGCHYSFLGLISLNPRYF